VRSPVLSSLLGSLALVASTLGALTHPVAAQTDVTLEAGASQIGPPLGVDSESARFAVAGLRASHHGMSGSGVYGSLLAGRVIGDANGGDFVTAHLGGTVAEQWTARWSGAFDLRVLAFGVRAPFPYSAIAVEGGPKLTVTSGPVWLEVAGLAGSGHSRFEVWRVLGGRTRVFEESLARVGGTARLGLTRGPARVALAGGIHRTHGGSFRSGGASLLLSGRLGAVELRADVWRTPLGTETTGGLALVIPLSGWSLRGFFGRSEPDPLTLAEPGSTSGGILLGRSLYGSAAAPSAEGRPWELLAETGSGARVRLSIEAPPGTRRVELVGDFTLWEPIAMVPKDGRWEARVDIGPGTYHYGFLVDDEWYVPDDTRDVVPDEWGRLSAILVIEGVE
jgi:hypothetical protein